MSKYQKRTWVRKVLVIISFLFFFSQTSFAEINPSEIRKNRNMNALAKVPWIIPAQEALKGDVNGDKKITKADADLVLRYTAGMQELSGDSLLAADYNNDGVVNSKDAIKILNVIAPPQIIASPLDASLVTVAAGGSYAYTFDVKYVDTLMFNKEGPGTYTVDHDFSADIYHVTFTWNTTGEDIGPNPVSIKMTDTSGQVYEKQINIQVTKPEAKPDTINVLHQNNPPTISTQSTQITLESGKELSIPISLSDPDASDKVVKVDSFMSGPSPIGWARIDFDVKSGKYNLVLTPPAGLEPGSTYTINVVATDSKGLDQSLPITVTIAKPTSTPVEPKPETQPVYQEPSLGPITCPATASLDQPETLSFTVNNPGGQALTAKLTVNGKEITLTSTQNNIYTYTFTPEIAHGIYGVVFSVGDGKTTKTETKTITVKNIVPAVTSPQVTPITEEETFKITLPEKDADGDVLSYSKVNEVDSGTINGNVYTWKTKPGEACVAKKINIKVNDGYTGGEQTIELSLTVNKNQSPEQEQDAKIQKFIEALGSDDLNTRRVASDALVKIGKPAVPALISALNDPESGVRGNAAWALSEIKDPRAVSALINTLNDPSSDSWIRGNAKGALTMMDTFPDLTITPASSTLTLTPGKAQEISVAIQGTGKEALKLKPVGELPAGVTWDSSAQKFIINLNEAQAQVLKDKQVITITMRPDNIYNHGAALYDLNHKEITFDIPILVDKPAPVAQPLLISASAHPQEIGYGSIAEIPVTLSGDGADKLQIKVAASTLPEGSVKVEGKNLIIDHKTNKIPKDSYTLTLQAVDNDGNVKASTKVTIEIDNNPPEFIEAILAQQVTAGQTITIKLPQAQDIDKDDLTYSVDGVQGSINSKNEFVWTPSDTDVGTQKVTIKVMDKDGEFDTQTFTIEVERRPVTLGPITVNKGKDVLAGEKATLTFSVDGLLKDETVTVKIGGSPPVRVVGVDNNYTVIWIPEKEGTYTITILASDGYGEPAQKTITLTVKEKTKENIVPTITASTEPATTFNQGESGSLPFSVSDDDLASVLVDVTGVVNDEPIGIDKGIWTGWFGIIKGEKPGEYELTVSDNVKPGSYNVSVQVTDAAGAKAPSVFTIKVIPSAQKPEMTVSAPETVALGASGMIFVKLIGPQAGEYELKKGQDVPEWAVIGEPTVLDGIAIWVVMLNPQAGQAEVDKTYSFAFIASKGKEEISQTIQVKVIKGVELAPSAQNLRIIVNDLNISLKAAENKTIIGMVSGGEGEKKVTIEGPEWVSLKTFDQKTGVWILDLKPGKDQGREAPYPITLIAIDEQNNKAAIEISVKVDPIQQPVSQASINIAKQDMAISLQAGESRVVDGTVSAGDIAGLNLRVIGPSWVDLKSFDKSTGKWQLELSTDFSQLSNTPYLATLILSDNQGKEVAHQDIKIEVAVSQKDYIVISGAKDTQSSLMSLTAGDTLDITFNAAASLGKIKSCELIDGPKGGSIKDNVYTWKSTDMDSKGTVKIKVTDENGKSVIKEFNIKVNGSVDALIKSFQDSPVDDLIKALKNKEKSSPQVRLACVKVLGSKLSDLRAVYALIYALEDPNPDVVVAATEILIKTDDPRIANALVEVLWDDSSQEAHAMAIATFVRLGRVSDGSTKDLTILAGKHPDPDVRLAAIEALGNIKGVPEIGSNVIPILIDRLSKDSDPDVRLAALKVLNNKTYDSRVLPALFVALADSDPAVRKAAVEILAEIDAPGVIPALVEMLGEEKDPNILSSIVAVLGNSQDQRAVESLIHLAVGHFGDGSLLSSEAIEALGKIGGTPAEDFLLGIIKGSIMGDYKAAEKALGTIGSPRVILALREMSNDPQDIVRTSVVKALSYMGAPGVDALIYIVNNNYDDVTCFWAEDALVEIGAPAVPYLIKALSNGQDDEAMVQILTKISNASTTPAEVRISIAASLEERRVKESDPGLINLINSLKASPGSPSEEAEWSNARRSLYYKIGEIGTDEAVDYLIAHFEDDFRFTGSIIQALGMSKNSKAVDFLNAKLNDDQTTPYCRELIKKALEKKAVNTEKAVVKTEKAVDMTEEAMIAAFRQEGTDPAIRNSCAEALVSLPSTPSEFLIEVMNDWYIKSSVRKLAVQALASRGAKDSDYLFSTVVPAFIAALESQGSGMDDNVRKSIKNALQSIPGSSTLNISVDKYSISSDKEVQLEFIVGEGKYISPGDDSKSPGDEEQKRKVDQTIKVNVEGAGAEMVELYPTSYLPDGWKWDSKNNEFTIFSDKAVEGTYTITFEIRNKYVFGQKFYDATKNDEITFIFTVK